LRIEVAICGVMTNLCCETTARSAFCKNYNVLFIGDGCATATDEMHKMSLINLSYGFARVISNRQFQHQIQQKGQ
jgi:isochorismate hydrolase